MEVVLSDCLLTSMRQKAKGGYTQRDNFYPYVMAFDCMIKGTSNLTSNNSNFGESDALKPLDLLKACRKGPLEAPDLVKFSPKKKPLVSKLLECMYL